MVATFKEGLDVIIDNFKDNWNRANTDNIKPVIIDIADTSPERGKRIDLSRSDYVLVFETAHNEEIPDILYDFVTTRINITVDIELQKTEKDFKKWRMKLEGVLT